MVKRLRSLTVIPEALYVEREADRQLEGIVANMGRPGYVLVARQMGKTNLLLHARRRAVDLGLFVYLDLSNSFPDLRSFLRNIIDVALESTSNLGEVARNIRLARTNLDRLPHKEHEWELRSLLADIDGKLVICLDEIDSLTKAEYSDQVFSFVRSVYFSGRANFPVLERLTYILSGVAEPSDIIKNRDISPFNIGEKILLQDFSANEVQELIARAGMAINQETAASIYEWTNGHPRMTWDVCSQLEDIALSGVGLSPAVVAAVVRQLYFAEVNMPPIDQIKRLAEDSPEIRDALISVHYRRGNAVPDAMRTRLYLAGICQAPQATAVWFKNKVIEEALSEKFLLSIATIEVSEAPIVVGEQYFHDGDFAAAAERFSAALKAAEDIEDSQLQGRSHYWLGRARLEVGDLDAALAEFHAAAPLLHAETAIENSFFSGHVHLARSQYKEARGELEKVVTDSTSRALVLEASVDLAGAIVAIDPGDKDAAAERLCLDVCNSPAVLLNTAGRLRMGGNTLALAHHILAGKYLRQGKRSAALREVELGLETASLDIQIRLLLLQADVQLENKEFFFTKSLSLISAESNIGEGRTEKGVSYETCRDLVIRLDRAGRSTDALTLVEYMLGSRTTDSEFVDWFDRIAADLIHGAATTLATRLFEQTLRKHWSRFSPENARQFIATLSGISPERAFGFSEQFLDLVEDQGGDLKASELKLLHNIVFYSITSNTRNLAQQALDLLQYEPTDFGTMGGKQHESWKIFKEYLESYSRLAFDADASSFARCRRLFWLLEDNPSFDLGNIGSDFVTMMRSSLEREMRLHSAKYGEVRRIRKIGRNETISVSYGGQVRRGKFKHFQADLQAGRCTLVDA